MAEEALMLREPLENLTTPRENYRVIAGVVSLHRLLMNAPKLANGLLIQPVADFLVALGDPAASAEMSASSTSPSA